MKKLNVQQSGFDINDLAEKSRNVFFTLKDNNVKDRVRWIKKIRSAIVKHQEILVDTLVKETGKPATEIFIQEITASLGMLKFIEKSYPRWLKEKKFRYWSPGFWSKSNKIIYEPLGIIGIIGPSNFPFFMPMAQTCAALICGNTVILKTSELCPKTSALIEKIFYDAGLPIGLVYVINGAAKEVEVLISTDNINKIIFTGTYRTGKRIAELCGKYFKPCILELGGNGAAIVCDDANLKLAAKGIVWGSFYSNGNSCVNTKRVFVDKKVFDEFCKLIIDEIKLVKCGNPINAATEIGKVKSQEIDKLQKNINKSKSKHGIQLWTPKGKMTNLKITGNNFPLIVINESYRKDFIFEDIQAPVLSIFKYDSLKQSVQFANDSKYGLSASIWSRNKSSAEKIASSLNAGIVWINDSSAGLPQFPWGGVKKSGWGKTFSKEGLLEITNSKVISFDRRISTKRKFWWFPYSNRKKEFVMFINKIFFGNHKFKILLQYLFPHKNFSN